MTSPSRRRASLFLASLLGFTAAALTTPVVAVPVSAPYSCSSPDYNSGSDLALTFTLDTNAPGTMYVGRSATPTMTVQTTIPGNIVGLAALFGVKSASATGTFTVGVNGVATPRPFVFPRTDIPQSAEDYPVTIAVPLPAVTRTTAGSVVYKPGPVAISLTGYNKKTADAQDGDDVGSIAADCEATNPNQVIDTMRFIRSPSTITGSVVHAKAAKKVTATAKVVARSGVVPTGSVRMVLFKGTKKVAAKTVSLVGGRATTAFVPVRAKGSYKVVTTYAGDAATTGSTVTRSFRVR